MSEPARQKQETEVVIVGGGLNGPMLALALAQAGVPSTVIDAGARSTLSDPGFDGRAYALNVGTVRMLKALGLWPELEPVAQPVLDIKVSHGRAGEGAAPQWVHFHHAEIEEDSLGYLVEDRHLRAALLRAVDARPQVATRWQEAVVAQSAGPARAEVHLGGGDSVEGRVLVGCDGRSSGTARRAGIGRTGWPYRQMALVAAIAHEQPHHGTAHQIFLPEGPLAILPLRGRRSSIVWTEEAGRAEVLRRLDDEHLLAVLRPRFGDFLGELRLEGARYTYPLSLSLAERLVAERVALVGDAAHGIHPLAGQGLNLGFRDIAALAEVLVDARRSGRDLGARDVLARYAGWRGFDSASLAFATDAIHRVFSTQGPTLALGRAVGLALVGGVSAIRRSLTREAAGTSGDLPRLQRGLPL